MSKVSRRAFLTKGGALALGFSLPLMARAQEARPLDGAGTPSLPEQKPAAYHNAYIRINPDNHVTILLPDAEIGQGIYTAASMILAEELDIDLAIVTVEAAPPDPSYILAGQKSLVTWGSGSTAKDWVPLQNAAAMLRLMLVEAAARAFGVDVGQCRTELGAVHGPNGAMMTYGQLLNKAVLITPPQQVTLKNKEEYRLIGHSQPRVDTAAKLHGTAIYGIDMRLPEMKVGLVVACPVVGGKIARINDQKTRQVTGVIEVLRLQDAVCVVADHFWAASKGIERLDIEWDFGQNASVTTQDIYKKLQAASAQQPIVGYANSQTKIEIALSKSAHHHKMAYTQPMLAHAAMEPLNCTVHVQAGQCEVWMGSQAPLKVKDHIASLLHVDADKVVIHNLFIGGSFGRRLEDAYIVQSVQFAQQVSYPLKCIWSRAEDFGQDHVRPAYLDQVEAGVNSDGQVIAFKHLIVGPSITKHWDETLLTQEGMDPDLLLGLNTMPYQLPAYQVNYIQCDLPEITPGWWQGNGATRNIFVLETAMADLAKHAKKDPIEYRKELKPDDRGVAVMDMVAQHAQWDQDPAHGIRRGFAMAHVFGSYIAAIVEAEITAMSIVKLHRVIVAVDCGMAVNPDQITAQIESGIILGLGTALYNEVTLKNGQIVERNFNQYRVLRMNESPQIEVHIIKSDAPPSGVGELGTIIVIPALANALGLLKEKSFKSLPLAKQMA